MKASLKPVVVRNNTGMYVKKRNPISRSPHVYESANERERERERLQVVDVTMIIIGSHNITIR